MLSKENTWNIYIHAGKPFIHIKNQINKSKNILKIIYAVLHDILNIYLHDFKIKLFSSFILSYCSTNK